MGWTLSHFPLTLLMCFDQPLDVTCFKAFKVAYHAYRDKSTLNNKGKVHEKEDLASWVSVALKRALISTTITKEFMVIGIYSFYPKALDGKMHPSFIDVETLFAQELSSPNKEEIEKLELREVQDVLEEVPTPLPECHHYYVELEGTSKID